MVQKLLNPENLYALEKITQFVYIIMNMFEHRNNLDISCDWTTEVFDNGTCIFFMKMSQFMLVWQYDQPCSCIYVRIHVFCPVRYR